MQNHFLVFSLDFGTKYETPIPPTDWRSCDTEDWSNDAENIEINYSLTYIHIENGYLKFKSYFKIFTVFLIK